MIRSAPTVADLDAALAGASPERVPHRRPSQDDEVEREELVGFIGRRGNVEIRVRRLTRTATGATSIDVRVYQRGPRGYAATQHGVRVRESDVAALVALLERARSKTNGAGESSRAGQEQHDAGEPRGERT